MTSVTRTRTLTVTARQKPRVATVSVSMTTPMTTTAVRAASIAHPNLVLAACARVEGPCVLQESAAKPAFVPVLKVSRIAASTAPTSRPMRHTAVTAIPNAHRVPSASSPNAGARRGPAKAFAFAAQPGVHGSRPTSSIVARVVMSAGSGSIAPRGTVSPSHDLLHCLRGDPSSSGTLTRRSRRSSPRAGATPPMTGDAVRVGHQTGPRP
jgi:hypothetical protein